MALAFLARHWRMLAGLGVVIGLAISAYAWGSSNATARVSARYERELQARDQAAAQALAAALAQAQRNAAAAADAERKFQAAEDANDAHFGVIEKEVVRYVQAHPDAAACGLDADGLRLWNEANRGGGSSAHRNP